MFFLNVLEFGSTDYKYIYHNVGDGLEWPVYGQGVRH